jgi:hypothetical protein
LVALRRVRVHWDAGFVITRKPAIHVFAAPILLSSPAQAGDPGCAPSDALK